MGGGGGGGAAAPDSFVLGDFLGQSSDRLVFPQIKLRVH